MYIQFYRFAFVLVATLLSVSSQAFAISGSHTKDAFRAPSSSNITDGATTVAPFGHVAFCQTHPQHCKRRGRHGSVKTNKGRVVLTKARWNELTSINARINRRIISRTDHSQHGVVEKWTISPARYGDCEDYALTKRQYLMRRGWPSSALRIAVVVTPKNEVHAVLVAKTTQGDYVLDNLNGRVKPWNRTGFRWVKHQSANNPRRWVSFGGRRVSSNNRVSTGEPRRAVYRANRNSRNWQRVSQSKRDRLSVFLNR